jgi:hypothetical protein
MRRKCLLFLLNIAAQGCVAAPEEASSHNASSAPNPHSEPGLPTGVIGSARAQIRTASRAPVAGDGTGAFRTTCRFSHMRHDDPIVHPEQAGASHLHAFFGNTEADAFSTADSLARSGNSTCRGGIVNRSSYWVPALLNDDAQPLTPEPAQFYYKSGYDGIAPQDIEPFPQGLRIIAGDPQARSAQANAGWRCEGSDSEPSGGIPTCAPGRLLVMHVSFPQCWNGRDTDSEDHRRHMAYPEDGACPVTHPVPIPAITFNIPYRVGERGSAGYRLDSDGDAADEAGYSAHGDWFGAWDREVVEVWVEHCINLGLDCHSHLLGDGREIYFVDGEP